MFILEAREDAERGANASMWHARTLGTKDALPMVEYVVVAAECDAQGRQLTCLGGQWKATPSASLVLLPMPHLQRDAAPSIPTIQVLEVGELAVQFLQDVSACFPSLVRRSPLQRVAYSDSDSDSDDSENEDADEETKQTRERSKKRRKQAAEPAAPAAPPPISPDVLAFLGRTKAKVLESFAELCQAYRIADASAIEDALKRDDAERKDVQWLCMELPPCSAAVAKECNFGVLFVQDRIETASKYLHIPLPRDVQHHEDGVYQDATVFTFNSKREATEHGGGKTSEETVKNIRMRHASGTFCTLVYPTMEWQDVVTKHASWLPQLNHLHGDLRSRKVMGMLPDHPLCIVLEQ